MKQIIILGFMILFLSACSNDAEKALESAKAEVTPENALKIIRQAEETHLERCKDNWRCSVPEELETADRLYFTEAAKGGNEPVLRELFTQHSNFKDLKNEVKDEVLKRAIESKSLNLLVAAAAISGDDTLGVVNKVQQIEYLKRAWALGDVKSAGKLAHIYIRLKDYDNSYFWSLRCIQQCSRSDDALSGEKSYQIELNEIEKHLDADRIATLQSKSALKTVTIGSEMPISKS